MSVEITAKAFARVGLIGNPSDGYFGKTISFVFRNFFAEVRLHQTPTLEIVGNERDRSIFRSMEDLSDDVSRYGYYGGIRLLKATVKRFFEYCSHHQIPLENKNFTLHYRSNIPHRVGLAGSSAIITACLRTIIDYYGVSIPKPEMADLILKVETDELGISAGLQDRVIQVYEGLVFMDFDRQIMAEKGHGLYQYLDVKGLPPLYIAYLEDASEGSEVFHNNIRERFDRGEKKVVDAMKYWSDLTVQARTCLEQNMPEELGDLINRNFDMRRSIYQISQKNLQLVDAARSTGATAKFTGSGGAIVGTYRNEKMYDALVETLTPLGICVLKPDIQPEKR